MNSPMNGEKPHVFREATKEVAFRNTCGFWADYLWANNRGLPLITGDNRATFTYSPLRNDATLPQKPFWFPAYRVPVGVGWKTGRCWLGASC